MGKKDNSQTKSINTSRFALKTISDTTLVFENLQHDFPQVISYAKIDKDRLVAEISGVKNGQQRKQTFPMQRIR